MTVNAKADINSATRNAIVALTNYLTQRAPALDSSTLIKDFGMARDIADELTDIMDAITCVLDLRAAALASIEEDQP